MITPHIPRPHRYAVTRRTALRTHPSAPRADEIFFAHANRPLRLAGAAGLLLLFARPLADLLAALWSRLP